MLLSDLQHDFVRTCISPLSGLDPARLKALVQEMTAEGLRQLRAEGIDEARCTCTVALDLRYLKQYHEVTLPVPLSAVEGGDRTAVARAFHAEHNRLYGYDLAEQGTPLELINIRVRTVGHVERVALPRLAAGTRDPEHAAKRRRRAFVPERAAFAELPVYDGHELLAGDTIPGPALIERVDTTILVSAAYRATIDAHGSCLIERTAARRESEVAHG
jgi:N-methylhydantoinase A